MKILIVLLVACSTKQAAPPSLESFDRSCKVDADCMLVTGSCCSGCGDEIGAPVNGQAWMKARDARLARCDEVECPTLNCATPPDCREESVAVCQAGTCSRVMRKTAACEVKP